MLGSATSEGRAIIEYPPDPDLALVGTVLGGRYELYALLGKGGFGAVYASRHQLTGQELVVKVLRANMAQDPVQLRRFLNEAKAACQLTHPNTVRVFDFGQTDDKQLYMAMERLHGKEMADIVKADAPLDPFRVIHIAVGVLKSLSEAHASGLVHRDLKPGNIFLCDIHGEPDFVKLIDFGIAKSYDGDDPEHDLTKTGFAVGTPKYMSPEQGRAEPLDGRSDLYSLGIILYEALSGSVPFTASSAMAIIVKHLQEAPVPVSQKVDQPLPEGLEEVVMRSLAKDPWDRFTDADDMRAALEAVMETAGRAVAERGRAVSAKFRAVPTAASAAAALAGFSAPDTDPGPEIETVETSAAPQPPGSAALTAQAAGAALRGQAAQQAQTVRIETGKQAVAVDASGADEPDASAVEETASPADTVATAAAAPDDAATPAGAAPAAAAAESAAAPAGVAASSAAAESLAAANTASDDKAPPSTEKQDGPGVHTRLVKGAAQPSVVPSTPSRPSRNHADRAKNRDSGGSGRLAMIAAAVLALSAGGWWFWTESKGEKPIEVLSAAATELKAQVGTSVREPLAARTGTRERTKPRLKKGSARRAEVEKFHKDRYKGVGRKNEPLSTKEIDKAMDRTDSAMIRCVRKHGAPGVAVKRISMDMVVDKHGKVETVEVNGDHAEGALGPCIIKVAKRVKFRSDIPAKQSFTAFVAFPPTKSRAKAPGSKPAVKRRAKRTPKPKKPTFNGDAAL